VAVAAVLALAGALVFWLAPPGGATPDSQAWTRALEWRPGLAPAQPWRWWTAACVHWSAGHLAANLLGDLVVALLGWRARVPAAAALAWLIAWPLTQALFDLVDPAWLGPSLQHYGGLSGVLHAGVVIAGLCLLRTPRPPPDGADAPRGAPFAAASGASWAALPPMLTAAQARRHRAVGAALVVGTLCKVLLEAPWNPALRPNALLGIEVAPIAHACGLVAGALAFGVTALAGWRRGRQRR